MTLRHAPFADHAADFGINLARIEPDAWFEGGDPQADRKAGLLAAGASVFGEMEGSRPGQAEALAMVEAATGRRGDPDLPPLWAASLLVADDLCLMEKTAGAWRLTAVSLCSGTFFTAGDALGGDLSRLHGPVPGFEGAFLPRVSRMFDAIAADVVVERRNWTIVNAGEAHLPNPAPVRATLPQLPLEQAGEGLFLRVERQTLRRLPATGGVLFTIRVWTDPLAALLEEPDRLAAFANAWRTATDDFRAYKGLARYDAHVERFLAQAAGSEGLILPR